MWFLRIRELVTPPAKISAPRHPQARSSVPVMSMPDDIEGGAMATRREFFTQARRRAERSSRSQSRRTSIRLRREKGVGYGCLPEFSSRPNWWAQAAGALAGTGALLASTAANAEIDYAGPHAFDSVVQAGLGRGGFLRSAGQRVLATILGPHRVGRQAWASWAARRRST